MQLGVRMQRVSDWRELRDDPPVHTRHLDPVGGVGDLNRPHRLLLLHLVCHRRQLGRGHGYRFIRKYGGRVRLNIRDQRSDDGGPAYLDRRLLRGLCDAFGCLVHANRFIIRDRERGDELTLLLLHSGERIHAQRHLCFGVRMRRVSDGGELRDDGAVNSRRFGPVGRVGDRLRPGPQRILLIHLVRHRGKLWRGYDNRILLFSGSGLGLHLRLCGLYHRRTDHVFRLVSGGLDESLGHLVHAGRQLDRDRERRDALRLDLVRCRGRVQSRQQIQVQPELRLR